LMQANTDGMPGVGGRGVVTAPGAEALAWRPHGHGTGGGHTVSGGEKHQRTIVGKQRTSGGLFGLGVSQ